MNKHLKYASYVLRHKWYVLQECYRCGILWRGIKHDWHKMLPSEWVSYVEHFYGDGGDLNPAWLRHQKRSDHHWQWWVLTLDTGEIVVLPMSQDATIEMVCDWVGASKACGRSGVPATREWYKKNKDGMRLHPVTRHFIEKVLLADGS